MATSLSTIKDRIAVQISKDKLFATVQFLGVPGDEPPTENEVIAALMEVEIRLTDDVRERVRAFIEQTTTRKQAGPTENANETSETDEVENETTPGEETTLKGFLVAKGIASCSGKDESVVWSEEIQEEKKIWKNGLAVDFYSFNQIVTVDKDTFIGLLAPIVPPKKGEDVLGQSITAEGDPKPMEFDNTITKTNDTPPKLIANLPGKVVQTGNKITIDEVVLIKGDIGFETGNINTPANVHIKGAIPDRFQVRSEKSITVESVIEAAQVRAGKEIVVKGGIVGRSEGGVTSEGDISAKFCTEANLTAAGDIRIQKQIMASRLYLSGKLLAEQSAVIGGHVYASQGVEIGYLGNDTDTPTSIVVGCDLDRLIECASIDARSKWRKEAALKIIQEVETILNSHNSLTSSQRQRVNSLKRKADSIKGELAKELFQQQQLLEKIVKEGDVNVTVNKRIYRNASITIGRRMTLFEKHLGGPVIIKTRQIKNVTEIVAINTLTASIQILKSYKLTDEEIYQNFKTLVMPQEVDEKG